MKKLMALLLALVMVLGLTATAYADESSKHTITITNNDQNVAHTYEAYQVFVGKLDGTQTKLADIQWGTGVDGDGLLVALKASTDTNLAGKFDDCTTAADVAEVFATFTSTNGENESSGAIDAVAAIIAKHLSSTKTAFTADPEDAKKYTAEVTGDGYYFVKDTTTTLTGETGSDTLSKYLLAVVKDTTIVAKDTGTTPDKKIVDGEQRVEEGTAAVGDTVTFEVKVKVPNTKKYVDHFIFDMVDKLPKGMTFTGITSVKVGSDNVAYTLKVDDKEYTAPTDPVDANAPKAGQTIKLVFTNFKADAEAKNWIGQDMVITYTAVVNKNADFTPTGNKNEVKFDFSNDPNHTYTGDEPGPDEPMGESPKDETTTYLTNIEINKVDDKQTALAGAEFEITSDDYNVTLVTGEKFEAANYQPGDGETAVEGTWYKLKDGSYTTTAPTDATASSYDSTTTTYKKISFSKTVTTPGTTKKVTVISGEDGVIKLEGLKPGTYTIKETKAPTGFNLDATEHVIKIKWDAEQKKMVLDTGSDKDATFDDTTATAKITIVNKSGAELPSTGGIGTTIFYIVGAILVLGAGVALITRKRMSAM